MADSYLDFRRLQQTIDGLADVLESLRIPGPPGDPGEDADPAVIRSLVNEATADPALLRKLIAEAIAPVHEAALQAAKDAVAAVPRPKNGDPGKPGKPGINADPAAVREMVANAVASIPTPKGDPGKPGKGVPAGGEPGYILAKLSDEDYDTHWIKLPGGAGQFTMWNGTGGGTTTLFGAGDPSASAAEGTLYFDTTDSSAYAGWVYHSGAWHPFATSSSNTSNWILDGGTWHDTGVWDDTEFWED